MNTALVGFRRFQFTLPNSTGSGSRTVFLVGSVNTGIVWTEPKVGGSWSAKLTRQIIPATGRVENIASARAAETVCIRYDIRRRPSACVRRKFSAGRAYYRVYVRAEYINVISKVRAWRPDAPTRSRESNLLPALSSSSSLGKCTSGV